MRFAAVIRTLIRLATLLHWSARLGLALLATTMAAGAALAQSGSAFDHNATLFPLVGAHGRVACDDCHKSGLPAKGLPRTCNTCHVQGGMIATTFKPPLHIPVSVTQQCSDCHNQNAWTPAVMVHTSDMFGQCARCHNNSQASGKPPAHLPTTASCDACHAIGAWTPVKAVVHDASTVGRCSTCHNGVVASGKPPLHVPTTAQCDTCHTSTVTWLNAIYTHDPSTWGRCSSCHNYNIATGKGANHIPTNSQCDTCHTSQITFTAVTMNHTGLNGQCSTCHGGAYLAQNAQTKPATHVPTTAQCDSCHNSTTSWATAAFVHPANAVGQCSTCHVAGGTGLAKPSTHIPTTLQCDTCHTNYVAFKPAVMNHVGTTGQCATCHNGAYTFANALSKPAIHIPTTRSCDACHLNFSAFAPGIMDHTGTAGQCSSCHNGAYLSENAQMKPVNHVVTSAQCDTCHSGTTTWATAGFTHDASAVGNCSNCHVAGGAGLAKPTNHIPTIAQCDTCHTNYVAFKPATMNHTGTTGTCSTCHNGSYAFANANPQGVTHIPDARQCDTCHTSTTLWTQRAMNHAGLAGKCSACHGGAFLSENAQAKSAAHIPTSAQCDGCHISTTVWTQVQHLATGIAGQCQTCHNGAYTSVGADAKPLNHIPYDTQLLAGATMSCDACHLSTAAWTSEKMNHNNSLGNGSGWCKACHQSGTSYLGSMQTKSLTHQKSTGVTDCSQSGCHRPLGNQGSTYKSW